MLLRAAVLSLGLGVMGFSAFAAGPLPPPDLCAGTGCTPAMQSIFDAFRRTPMAPDARVFPAVFSGECYYLGFDTDPNVTQYGVTLLDLKEPGKPWFMSLFSFFDPSDPFKELDVVKARALLAREGGSGAPLAFNRTFAYAEFPGDSPATRIRYWIRQDPRSERVLLVSLWAFANPPGAQEIFCDLAPNHFVAGP